MFKIGRRNRRKKRVLRIFKKNRNLRSKKNSKKSKLKEAVKRVETSNQYQLEIINDKDKSADKSLNNSEQANYAYDSENKADIITPNDDLINVNTQRIKIKSKTKENREYVEKVRNQVKEVLEEKYDESFEKLFNEFEKNGFINRDNFLFRLIFMILKKYGFIDIFNEDGEIDPNAIDTILKSIVKDAYKMISDDEKDNKIDEVNNNENNNAYKCHKEQTGEDYSSKTYDDSFYEDEE